MNECIPVTITSIDFDTHLRYARQQLNRSVTSSLDRAGKPITTPSSFLVTLSECVSPTSQDHTAILRSASGLLRHVSGGFLFSSDQETLLHIIEHASLACNRWSNKTTMIVSGDMQEWITNIQYFSLNSTPRNVRDLFNRAMLCFEAVGFGPLWEGFHKTQQSDKTFVLTEKR